MTKAIIVFISKNRKFLFWGSFTVLFILIVVMIFVFVVRLPHDASIFMAIAGNTAKLEVIKLIGWGISGIIAVLSVVGLLQRAAASDKQNEMTEKGHMHERFKVAIEHLGNEQDTVRIAAFYEFYHLAKTKRVWQRSIFNILCAHLRQTTKHKGYNKDGIKKIKPTEEVQTLLAILFTQRDNDDTIFNKLTAHLKGANLQGADLRKAPLQGADLEDADLEGADLEGAFLQGAFLQGADLRGAKINKTTTIMPPNWENVVKKDNNGKTGVIFVDD